MNVLSECCKLLKLPFDDIIYHCSYWFFGIFVVGDCFENSTKIDLYNAIFFESFEMLPQTLLTVGNKAT